MRTSDPISLALGGARPSRARVGVVGHVEWVQFATVPHVPAAGEIVHSREFFEVPGGGGAVAAVQLSKLAGSAIFLTAVGDDDAGRRCEQQLRHEHGVDVRAVRRPGRQRQTFTFLDDGGERTITVLGERVVPHRDDPLPWQMLAAADALYFTGGDAGAAQAARAARVLVATPRALGAIRESGVQLDVLCGSAVDPGEVYEPGMLDPEPLVVVRTDSERGGTWEATGEPPPWAGAPAGRWDATPLPGPIVDAYGCGDSFAAALTYGLGTGLGLGDALALAARCGASVLCGRGPYATQHVRLAGSRRKL